MIDKDMKLTENFSLAEMTRSMTATRLGIINVPVAIEIVNMSFLCEEVLQPVRDRFGPTKILSGYRSQELNKTIGGSSRSQHCEGMAADIECPGVDNFRLFGWIADRLEFDQLILEFYEKGNPLSGWVHVSYNKSGNRKNILVASKKAGTVEYRAVNSISEV